MTAAKRAAATKTAAKKTAVKRTAARSAGKTFSRAFVDELDAAKIIGVRSGDEHRFTGVWVVVVKRRAFVRSWNDKPTGWHRAFLTEPRGAIQVGDRAVAIRARPTRGEHLLDAIEAAYAEKFATPASRKWVVGFRRPQRRRATMELLPRA